MANTKGQAEKEKVGSTATAKGTASNMFVQQGNAAFKAADYPTAIGHYSAAILADRNDHTFPLNRAAAYLKLGKYEDAERDCTTVLVLSAMNAKALFRRGQARSSLGKLDDALSDLNQAIKREPSNAAISEEIKKVEGLLAKRKQKAPAKPISVSPPSSNAPKRRRVPIAIIEPKPSSSAAGSAQPTASKPATKPETEPTSGLDDSLKPVSIRSLNKSDTTPASTPSQTEVPRTSAPRKPMTPPSSAPTSPPAPAPVTPATTVPISPQPEQPRTFKDAKATRENARPSRVGGGIFRASGQNTIFPTRESPSSSSASSTDTKAKQTGDVAKAREEGKSTAFPVTSSGLGRPLTLFDFSRSWDSKPGSEDRWALITTITSSRFPSLFQTSLETSLLVSILALFKEVLFATGASGAQAGMIKQYMQSFGEVKRFETVLLFMSKAEKLLAVEVWSTLGVDKEDAGTAWSKVWS